jgi:hypothetical protein
MENEGFISLVVDVVVALEPSFGSNEGVRRV